MKIMKVIFIKEVIKKLINSIFNLERNNKAIGLKKKIRKNRNYKEYKRKQKKDYYKNNKVQKYLFYNWRNAK